jgi:hypothetical protein
MLQAMQKSPGCVLKPDYYKRDISAEYIQH